MKNEYKITVLEGPEAVRETSGMYIGNTEDGTGLHHLLMEVLDNSVDEYLAGYCNKIVVTLYKDGSASISDNGRGIPTYFMPEQNMSALEVVLCVLHAGGKFSNNENNYKISGGLHGVGVSVTNALSARLKVIVTRDGKEYSMAFEKGKKVEDLSERPIRSKETGTFIRFGPDLTIFKRITKFDSQTVERRLLEISYLCRGLEIEFVDERTNTKKIFGGDNDISGFIKYLGNGKLLDKPIVFTDKNTNIVVDVGLQWFGDGSDTEISKYYTNNIPNLDGGSHMVGFKTALTKTINSYINDADIPKSLKISLSGDDIREGLVSVVSIRHPDPKFSSQTKDKLVSEDARTAVENVVSSFMLSYLEQNPVIAKKIVTQCVNAYKAREAAKKAREATRKTVLKDGGGVLPGKLADCSSKDPEECELYIVEGSSAGGCWNSSTILRTCDGREVSIVKLMEEENEGIQNFCYTINNKEINVAPIKNIRKTKTNVKVIKIILDNGAEEICTPDHELMLVNGEYVQAKDSLGKSLMPLYIRLSNNDRDYLNGYEMVWSSYSNSWEYTHILSDNFNLKNKKYKKGVGQHRHHIDYNKLNNNPDNIIRMTKYDHRNLHHEHLEYTLHRPDVKEKSKKAKQTKEFREKMSKTMSTPEMHEVLSERAKRQWEDPEYKEFMITKWKEFYKNNEEYRKENAEQLFKNQQIYWSNEENIKKASEETIQYFKNPAAREHNRQKAIEEWSNEELIEWRREKTKEQWTDEFRVKRMEAYNITYFNHTIQFMKEIFDTTQSIDTYDAKRVENGSRNLLKKDTFLNRFFDGDEDLMMDAIRNYNHKVIEIITLEEKMDVYDLEVPGTHNFALASGIFVHNSAKQGRNREFQAVLPLRGKVLNVERCEFQKMMANEELTNLITAIGAGIGKGLDPEAIRYNKIILMCDSDVDGSHIRTLLLTFFFRQMPQLIRNGNIYIGQPPLYRVEWRKNSYYLKDEHALSMFYREKKISQGDIKLQRFKGLGEMNPEQLWNTTMNPDTRTLLKVVIEDYVEADRIFSILMGNQVEPRKQMIFERALNVSHLDT